MKLIPALALALITTTSTHPMTPTNKTQATIPASVQYTALAITLGGLGYIGYRAYCGRPREYFPSLIKAAKEIGKPDLISKEAHSQHLATFIKKIQALNFHKTTETPASLITADDNSQFTLECKEKNNFGFFAYFLSATQSTENNNTNYVFYYKYDDLLQKAQTIDLPEGAFQAFETLVKRLRINKEIEELLYYKEKPEIISQIESLIEQRKQL